MPIEYSAPAAIEKVGTKLVISITPGHIQFNAVYSVIREIHTQHGGHWNKANKVWEFPMGALDHVTNVLRQFGYRQGQALINFLAEKEAIANITYELPKIHYEYAKHQIDGIIYVLKNANAVLLDDQGLGKTLQAGVAIRMRHEMGACTRTLVIAPRAVCDVWIKELALVAPMLKTQILKAAIRDDTEVLICNYERVGRRLAALQKWAPDFVVLDEAHRVKQRMTTAAKSVKHLDPRFRLIMTGTLVANRPEDVWFPLQWCIPGFFPEYFNFLRTIADVGNAYSRFAINGYKEDALYSLREKISSVSLRRLKKDVLDLPDRTYQTRLVPMTTQQAVIYEQERLGMLKEYDEQGYPIEINALTKTLRLAQIAANPAMVNEDWPEISFKYEEALSLIEDNDNPTIVWSCYRYDLAKMIEFLDAEQISYVVYHGQISEGQRKRAIEDFQAGKARVFLGSPAACREGITLTAATSMIYLNRSYNLVHRLQSMDRNYRMGQDKPVIVYDLVTRGTIDELTLRALQNKQNMMEHLQKATEPHVTAEMLKQYLSMKGHGEG